MRSSDWFVVPFFAGALVLAWSGAAKLRKPGQLVRALSSAGLPAEPGGVRLIASVEFALGALCLARPTPAAAIAAGLAYLGFSSFLSFLLLTGRPLETCGCAGARDVPPSWLHVGLDTAAAGAALGYAATNPHWTSLMGTATPLPLHGISFLAGVILLGYLAFLAAAHLPGALAAYQEVRR